MSLHVAVDFGTSSTCVVVSVDGREPQVVVFDGQPLVPSAVFAGVDGTLFVGPEAERQAAVDPSRYEPHPKRRIDEGELLLGSTVVGVPDVVGAVLARAVGEARRLAGGAPADLLVLTHPADWGALRTGVLRRAGRPLAREVALLPEPVAAAVFHSASHTLPDGAALAVLDLGAGTVDASVVRRRGGTFQVLATRGDPNFGGADIDQALLEHVGGLVGGEDPDAWQRLVEGREMADRRRRRVLWQDVRGAKETLSRHAYTDVPMPPPFPDAHVTRADLERLVAAPLTRAVELLAATVADAGLQPHRLAGVFLVGGSSRIPLVARLVHERTGIVPITLDQPETVVARGALRALSADPHRTGSLPGPAGAMATGAPGRAPAAPAGVPDPAGRAQRTEVLAPVPAVPPPGGPTGFPAPSPGFPAGVLPGAAAPPGATPAVRRRAGRGRTSWLVAGAVVAVVAVGAGGWALTSGGGATGGAAGPSGPTATPAATSGREIAQYDYRFTVPVDWQQTGSEAATRKVQLRPGDEPNGDDLIAVQEQALNYDSTADRDRAVNQLRQQFQAAGTAFSGFDPAAQFAGRSVVYYRQRLSTATVDWYVVFQGRVQVSVGCQYTDQGRDRVGAACEMGLRTLVVAG
ncbi:type VII secretion-associated protein [Gandjariella thermophila]|uniref:Type VII secretion-associated protein n=1 Tax=Gandjariella thermophila TaxID=1931992 RepID=A0A4D4J5S8_9PSEU|nr:type VII secretion-associated protein [Gandjariella thermophila]GDY29313.1 hypothetical protein GTS_09460 [Gandjariella thermophila]